MLSYNPAFRGFVCLRCGQRFPKGTYDRGCPECLDTGFPVSVVPDLEDSARLTGEHGAIVGRTELGEGDTPLEPCEALADALGLGGLSFKREDRNPSGSHKDRLAAFFAWHAQQSGRPIVASSTGNAGIALARYAALNGCDCRIVLSADAPASVREEIEAAGAQVEVLATAERWARVSQCVDEGWMAATNYITPPVGSDPVGVSGYRSVGYELATQEAELTAIFVPTAYGDLLHGVAAGLLDARDDGLLHSPPRVYAVEPFPRLTRVLAGKDYRSTFGGSTRQRSLGSSSVTYEAVWALRGTAGGAVVTDDEQSASAQRALTELGIEVELGSASVLAAVEGLARQGALTKKDRVALVLTAAARS